jgi:hypothetical protein
VRRSSKLAGRLGYVNEAMEIIYESDAKVEAKNNSNGEKTMGATNIVDSLEMEEIGRLD